MQHTKNPAAAVTGRGESEGTEVSVTETATIPELVADVIRAKAQMDRIEQDIRVQEELCNRLRNLVYPQANSAYYDAEQRLKQAIAAQARELAGGSES